MTMSSKLKNQRPPLERWYSYILVVFIGYCIADLTILGFRDKMLPQSAPPPRPKTLRLDSGASRGAYNTIITRNVFSSDGVIPDALALKGQDPNSQKDQAPVQSSLPLNLIGTLVHSDPEKSIAAIELKGKNQTNSYTPKKDIEGMATIISVERTRVIFRNLNSNRLEFIEMKHDNKLAFGGGIKTAPVGGSKEVQKIGDNNFAIKRADLLKYTSDLSTVLMQARAVPNRAPGTGEINGYRLLDIQSGSIFEQLGLQRMDVIKGVDGNPVDSPGKAMELYNALKNAPKLSIQIERNGKTENMSYTIQ